MALHNFMATIFGLCTLTSANAETITLDFEYLPNFSWVDEYYNGGESSTGEIGPDYGVSFVNETMRIFSSDAIPGLFSNNPSGTNIISYDPRFENTPSMIVEGGFTGLSFYYSASGPFSIGVVDADLQVLGYYTFAAQRQDGCSDSFSCNWSLATLDFQGIARSLYFHDAANGGYDDFTFTLPGDPTGNTIPEPAQWVMLIAGFGLAGVSLRHNRARAGLPA